MITTFASELGFVQHTCALSLLRMADQSIGQTAEGWQSLGGALMLCEGSVMQKSG